MKTTMHQSFTVSTGKTITTNNIEIFRIIKESKDPAKTLEALQDILSRLAEGESMEEIAISYGLNMERSAAAQRGKQPC